MNMQTGGLARWADEDWAPRLHAAADLGKDPRPAFCDDLGTGLTPPPKSSAAAQVMLACVYGHGPEDRLVRGVADNLRTYRTGEPADDAKLFWWAAQDQARETLRWILELSGPPGGRQSLVTAAAEAGDITADSGRYLSEPLTRPEWADREVPWTFAGLIDEGEVRLPGGTVVAGDPWWFDEQGQQVARLPPGQYSVRIAKAEHPLYGRRNAAAELVVRADATAHRWELVGSYTVEAAAGCFASEAIFADEMRIFDATDHLLSSGQLLEHDAVAAVDLGEFGSIVIFIVGPQHQTCHTWRAIDANGETLKLVTDLGVLALDPAKARLPW
jgi:hypothetical protein